MQNVWLILNRASRSVGDDWEALLTTAFEARGWVVRGVTDFPNDALPALAQLGAVDLVAVAAGDGTINAVAVHLDDWAGALLVLPGGTMNLLAKALHGVADSATIIAAIADPAATKQLATVNAPGARAIVGAIVGPAASWVHAREAVRKNRWGKLSRAVRLAYLRTLSHAVHVVSAHRRSRGYRAVFIHPEDDMLSVVKVRASGWADGVRLGFTYLTGTWENATGVETVRAREVVLAADGPMHALFDGEPLRLASPTTLTLGQTKLRFVTTL